MHASSPARPRVPRRTGRGSFAVPVALLMATLAVCAGSGCWSEREVIATPESRTGACCNLSGACSITTQAACAGTWIGANTACSPNPCSTPPPTGACCSPSGVCTVATQASCTGTWMGGGTACAPNPCSTQPPTDYIATGLVGSFEAKEINTVSGAGIKVPLLAVPKTTGGGEGKMTFSIERDQVIAVTPPAGQTKFSDTYRFGPDGFVFERPVTVKLPVLGDTTGKTFSLCRVNQTTGKSEIFGGTYDRATKSIMVQTYKLSPWFVAGTERASTAWGAVEVTNSSLDQWLNLCVEEYNLRFGGAGEADAEYRGESSSSWAPVGEIGVTNHGLWFLPQGTYRVCAEMRTAGTISSPPGEPRHTILDVQVNSAWSYDHPVSTPLILSGLGEGATAGACPCIPVATPSVGTGDVQVTLSWHSAQAIDLDLWVYEPNGDSCYYGHTNTSTGGSLDLDNKCGNYVDGRPENIFWDNAPTGEYRVRVDWFSDCGSEVPSLGYDVRVVNATSVRTFAGSIGAYETVEVTRFTVTAGRPARFAAGGAVPAAHGPGRRLAKN